VYTRDALAKVCCVTCCDCRRHQSSLVLNENTLGVLVIMCLQTIYQRLFDWIVQRINRAIDTTNIAELVNQKDSVMTIGKQSASSCSLVASLLTDVHWMLVA